jgi:hypothetical protein
MIGNHLVSQKGVQMTGEAILGEVGNGNLHNSHKKHNIEKENTAGTRGAIIRALIAPPINMMSFAHIKPQETVIIEGNDQKVLCMYRMTLKEKEHFDELDE